MKDITEFINRELKPRYYSHLTEIFPEFHFKKKRDRYVSNLHADGTEGTGYKEERSVVKEKKAAYGIFDNTWQKSFPIIDVFMEINHITEVWEAAYKIADIIGVPRPEYKPTPEQKEKYRQQEKRRTALEASAERQKKALFAPEGKAVLDYLHSRGWTDSEIQKGELGYISTMEATTINAQPGIGDLYTFSIPLREGTTMYGFKFRNIHTNETGNKYRYLEGTDKKNHFFNLSGNYQENGAITVVEGELDALHAQIRGLDGMVATGGGGLTEELLDIALGRGIKRITLLFDKDTAGTDFLSRSIDVVHKKGLPVLVANFPDGEFLSDGRPIHDIDEYLQAHTPQELQSLINNAVSGSLYLLENLIQTTISEHGENLTDAIRIDLQEKVIALANHTPNEIERDIILSTYANRANIDGKQTFSEAALRAVADREKAAEETLRIKNATGKAIQEAKYKYEKEGDVQGALQTMGEAAASIKLIGDREKYGDLLRTPSREERIRKYKDKPEALRTSYQFTEGGELELPFTLPSGALTILAAPTSHGKSTFLRNLAIDVAKRYRDENKSVLYFTFEESEEDVIAQFTNTYIGKMLHAPSKKHTQVDTIIDYFKTGNPQYVGGNNAEISQDEFKRRELEFSTDYLDSGRIKIYYRDYDLETLIEALEFAVCNIPTKAIFIDYIQILRSQKFARQPRAEQLKEICISLKDFSVKYKIPVVLAAQLNREAITPLRMNNTQMAESSDIEKAANTIVCLWNSNFMPNKYGVRAMETKEQDEINALKSKGFVMGQEGSIFALVTKTRGSRGVGMYSIFEYKGYAGKVVENYKPEAEQQDLPFAPPSADEAEPNEPVPF